MTPATQDQAWRASPEGIAARQAFDAAYAVYSAAYDATWAAYRAASDVYSAAYDAWMAEHEEKETPLA